MKIRYSETTEVDNLKVCNTLYTWDDQIDIFQCIEAPGYEKTNNVSLSRETALKFAHMIIGKYEVKE